jgi:hypothetical protein
MMLLQLKMRKLKIKENIPYLGDFLVCFPVSSSAEYITDDEFLIQVQDILSLTFLFNIPVYFFCNVLRNAPFTVDVVLKT